MTTAVHDIVIAGGGVVGAAAALRLQRDGFDVLLVERGPAPRAVDPASDDLRVYALAPATIAMLNGLGAWPRIAAQRASAYERMRVWGGSPAEALEFTAGELRLPALGSIVENDLLLGELWRGLAPGRVRCGTWIEEFADDGMALALRLHDGTSVRARLLIAADGADSALRTAAGIEALSADYPQRAVVCHVQTSRPHERTAWQRFLPSGPLAFLPLSDGRCSIVWSTTAAEDVLALDDGAFCGHLGQALQGELGEILACSKRLSFPLRLLHAERYAGERFVLIGDSAHVIHPLAGQGVNLGLADVDALAGVLHQARDGGQDFAGLRVLKRYERTRRADNLEMLAVTDALYRAFGLQLAPLSRALDWGLGAVNRVPLVKRALAQRAAGLA